MGRTKHDSRGFTLIAALLIMLLLSALAVGLLFMVSNERHMAGNNLEDNMAFYGAESGIEKLTSDLAALYAANMVPTNAQIQNLTTFPPTAAMISNMNYTETITYALDANGNPVSSWNTISSGANQGLYAEIVPMTLQVIASRPEGAAVNMTRKVEMALIPVFQFGVFCGYDCSYFPGPNFSFGGRVHTNGNLFLASGGDLVFDDKISAFGEILTDELENGHLTTAGYGGTQFVPYSAAGCPLNTFPPPSGAGTGCTALPGAGTVPGDASWSGGYPAVGGAANPNFTTVSSGPTINYFMVNHLTGATNMQLPFVKNSCTSNPTPCTDPIAIIRKPLAGESAGSTLGSERLYNKAQIRILIADTIADLHPERGAGAIDADDVQFPNVTTFTSGPFTNATMPTPTAVGATEAFGFASNGTNGWVYPYTDAGLRNTWASWPLIGELTTNPASPGAMTGPWIRVEYLNNAGNWVGVTRQWLGYGFGQPFNTPPITPGSNPVNPNAILILQQLQPGVAVSAANVAATGNWYPINFYDPREGEMRDNNVADYAPGVGQPGNPNVYSSCAVNGIMSAVELDVGNLARWLNPGAVGGTIAGSGANVNFSKENGFLLYFSDHRGELPSTHPSNGLQTPAGIVNGESGIEDVVNSAQNLTSTTQDGLPEPATYYNYSPEDVDQNGFLDNWGEKNIGYGFGTNTNTVPLNVYVRVPAVAVSSATLNCAMYNTATNKFTLGANNQVGMANAVSGARHVLKLVDGGMNAAFQSFVPVEPAASGCTQSAANPTGCGGFTVASENPVYIQGNYNSSNADPFWATANNVAPTQTPHSAAAVIADAVTVLSNQWSDANSLLYPTAPGSRSAGVAGQDTYYRAAIAGGKNIPFPQPGWGAGQDFGTDGGLHNFLRYLENWGNVNLWYNGSLVSMYYAEYDTGTFKCCTTVYSPPSRKYYFDTLFLNPTNLPPGTPMFQDVVNLSYHQNFTPQ